MVPLRLAAPFYAAAPPLHTVVQSRELVLKFCPCHSAPRYDNFLVDHVYRDREAALVDASRTARVIHQTDEEGNRAHGGAAAQDEADRTYNLRLIQAAAAAHAGERPQAAVRHQGPAGQAHGRISDAQWVVAWCDAGADESAGEGLEMCLLSNPLGRTREARLRPHAAPIRIELGTVRLGVQMRRGSDVVPLLGGAGSGAIVAGGGGHRSHVLPSWLVGVGGAAEAQAVRVRAAHKAMKH